MGWKNHPRTVLLALLATHVLAHIDRNMLLGFAPQITRDLALNNAQYGFLTGAVWVPSARTNRYGRYRAPSAVATMGWGNYQFASMH